MRYNSYVSLSKYKMRSTLRPTFSRTLLQSNNYYISVVFSFGFQMRVLCVLDQSKHSSMFFDNRVTPYKQMLAIPRRDALLKFNGNEQPC